MCIDKTSSAELSEAINSLYAWYEQSRECYVFLDDVNTYNEFRDSRWFTRGWTLQELLAPSSVLFYSGDGPFLGSRSDLAMKIAKATGIQSHYILKEQTLTQASVAQRMCWASARQTTRLEDIAYSLLGIFQVNMPLLYGEGSKAFIRLQLAIIETSDDDSVFAWGLKSASSKLSLDHESHINQPVGVLAQSA